MADSVEGDMTDSAEHVQLRGVLDSVLDSDRDSDRDSDLEAFLAFEHDEEALRRSGFTPRPRDRFLTHWRKSILGDDTCLVRTVTVDGAPAGHVIAWWEGDRRFIGYWLGRPYWGRGIGSEAVALFLREERTRPLYADPIARNTASVRLLERLGFHSTTTVVRHGDAEHLLLVLPEHP